MWNISEASCGEERGTAILVNSNKDISSKIVLELKNTWIFIILFLQNIRFFSWNNIQNPTTELSNRSCFYNSDWKVIRKP